MERHRYLVRNPIAVGWDENIMLHAAKTPIAFMLHEWVDWLDVTRLPIMR